MKKSLYLNSGFQNPIQVIGKLFFETVELKSSQISWESASVDSGISA